MPFRRIRGEPVDAARAYDSSGTFVGHRLAFWLTVILTLGQAAPLGSQQALQAAPTEGNGELQGTYRRWLEQDVRYIIEDEECSSFVRLASNEERDRFIASFWSRRDPTPGTQKNEFKEEHYRRIAYSNDLFESSRAGWMTDRGRTYILLGPPDEIEAHPSGGEYRPLGGQGGFNSAQPFQVWMYRRLADHGGDIVLEFVDSGEDGEYPIRSDAPWNDSPQGAAACP